MQSLRRRGGGVEPPVAVRKVSGRLPLQVWPNTIDAVLLIVSAVLLGTSFDHPRSIQRVLNITVNGALSAGMLVSE